MTPVTGAARRIGAAPESAETLNPGPNPSNRPNRLEGSVESTETTKTDPIEHGTYRAYNKQKCRCCECREAARRHTADYRRRKFGDRTPKNIDAYRAAHSRVRRVRGAAAYHACEQCGQEACDWALINESPRAVAKVINGTQRRWSDHPDDYRPMCRACHRTYDSAWSHPIPREPKPQRDTTRCPNGHDRTIPGAIRRRHDGRMECVECARARVRRYRQKKHAAK